MKQPNCIDTIQEPQTAPRFDLPPWLGSMARLVGCWIERSRQRRQLTQLSDAALKDIGLTHADVRTELDKLFWQP